MSKNLLIQKADLEGPCAHMYEIVWEGGGRRPAELEGVFTSHDDAARAIFLFRGRANRGIRTVGPRRN